MSAYQIRVVGPSGCVSYHGAGAVLLNFSDEAVQFASKDEAEDVLEKVEGGYLREGYVCDIVNDDGE